MKCINLDVIANNYHNICNEVGNKRIYAVVKSDAYTLGLDEIFKLLYSLGIRYYCCNSIDEAIKLRKLNNDIYILLLSDFNIDDYDDLYQNNIVVSISDINKIKHLGDLKAEVKVNTGLNRYGIPLDQVNYAIKMIDNLEGIYTHISNYSSPYFYKQYESFLKYSKDIANAHYITSLGLNKETYFLTGVRIGMGLYKDSLSVYSCIKRINNVKRNDRVGYDYVANCDMVIGIINLGYYNGITTLNKGRYVYIKNRYYEIVSISMNHTFIKVDETINIDDSVELLGENVKISYVAKYLNVGEYEVFTSFRNIDVKYLKKM